MERKVVLKTCIMISALCLYVFQAISCQSKDDIVLISISHYMGAGDRQSHDLIGSDSISIEKLYNRSEVTLPVFDVQKYIMKRNSVKYLQEFFIENCDKNENVFKGSSDYFYIRVVQNDSLTECFLGDKSSSRAYFEKLRKWLEKAPDKDVEKLIPSLDQWTR